MSVAASTLEVGFEAEGEARCYGSSTATGKSSVLPKAASYARTTSPDGMSCWRPTRRSRRGRRRPRRARPIRCLVLALVVEGRLQLRLGLGVH
jgi:hypothetical protein